MNTLDNQEQVLVENPAAGTWTVRVTGTSVPTGPQSYGLAYSTAPIDLGACSELVSNGGFETDTSGWTLSGATARTAAPAAGHGSFSLQLGGGTNQTDEAFTEITVPADAGFAEWTYFWHMTTQEGTAGHPNEFFIAEVRDTGGTVLEVHDVRSDGWTQGEWLVQENIDLSKFAGQTVRLTLRGTNDGSLFTTFWVDDVSLQECEGIVANVFTDGFESGDTSAWDATVP